MITGISDGEFSNVFKTKVITLDKLLQIKESLTLKSSLIKEWKAHKNGVTSVDCYSDPIFFLSSGLDFKVHVWNEKFERIGSLITNKDPTWSLKINMDKSKQERREVAIDKYNAVKKISYDSLFDGDIKLRPLDVR